MLAAMLAVGAAMLAACGGEARDAAVPIDAALVDGDGPSECSPVIGDPARPIEVVPISAGEDGVEVELRDGDPIALFPPPQGGMILLAGGRARNLDGCASQVTASLRDPASGMVIALESRPSQLAAGADGWGRPIGALFWTLANVAPCPNAAAGRDVYGGAWQLEVRLDSANRSGTVVRTVVPTCGDDYCRCLCDADYQPGMCGGPFGRAAGR